MDHYISGNKPEYIFKSLDEFLRCGTDISHWVYDTDGTLLTCSGPDLTFNQIFIYTRCHAEMLEHFRHSRNPVHMSTVLGIEWAAAYQAGDGFPDRIHVIGPVLSTDFDFTLLRSELSVYEMPADFRGRLLSLIAALPVVPSPMFFTYTLMLHYAATGEHAERRDIVPLTTALDNPAPAEEEDAGYEDIAEEDFNDGKDIFDGEGAGEGNGAGVAKGGVSRKAGAGRTAGISGKAGAGQKAGISGKAAAGGKNALNGKAAAGGKNALSGKAAVGRKIPERKKNRQQVYLAEKALLENVRTGNLNYRAQIEHASQLIAGVNSRSGPLSTNCISVVVFSSLCTRAAIEGGLSPELAYNIGDRYIQEATRSTSVTGLQTIADHMYDEFIRTVHLHRQKPELHMQIRICRDYIDANPEEDISLKALAKRVNYTEYYLSRKFHQEMGCTVNEYIHRARTERAKLLLTASSMPIYEIAQRLHYSSATHFSDTFRKITGVYPGEYREGKNGETD